MKSILLETINILFIEFINLADFLHALFWKKYHVFYCMAYMVCFLKLQSIFKINFKADLNWEHEIMTCLSAQIVKQIFVNGRIGFIPDSSSR